MNPKENKQTTKPWEEPITLYPAKDIEGEIILEIGPGRGDFLFYLAEKNPNKLIYGIEIKGKRFDKLVRRVRNRKYRNVRLVKGDAREVVVRLFSENQISSIYINCPDPWPKKRHAKNRLLNEEFLSNCCLRLTRKGSLFISTDVKRYAAETFEKCNMINDLITSEDHIKTDSDEAFPTFFSQKWRKMGRKIYYQKHIKA